MGKTSVRLFLITSLLLIFSVVPAVTAQEVGEVRVGPTVVFRFYDDDAHNPTDRANKVSRRIEGLLDSSLNSDDVWYEKSGSGFAIYWGSEFITQVDPIQAKLNKSTPADLAKVWAGNLKRALKNNVFYVIPSNVTLTRGKSATVKVGGLATGTISRDSDGGNVQVGINQQTGEVTVTPTGVGKTRVVLRRGGAKTVLHVNIQQLAGDVPGSIETTVYGNPAPRHVLEYVAKSAVTSKVVTRSGAKMEICGPVRVAESLGRGDHTVAMVPVNISGKNYLAVRREIPVKIINTGDGFADMKVLMVSDRPEAIKSDGILFQDVFSLDQPTRLLYYHKNASKVNRHFWVELKNKGREPVQVITCGALAGPSRWGVTVGHAAAVRFLETYRDGVAYSLEIPAGGTLNLLDIEIPADQVICGYVHLQIKKGRQLEVLVKNSAGYKKDKEILPALTQPFDPFRIHPRGTFTPANLQYDIDYTVGQEEEAACVIGRAPWLIDPKSGEPNNGNYGVFYHFNLTLKNPTNVKKRLGFYLVPEGVLARGSFVINGKLMDTEIARKPGRLLFAVQDLLPGEQKEMTLITTPEGGSYYPAKVVIETVTDKSEPVKKKKEEELMDWPATEDQD